MIRIRRDERELMVDAAADRLSYLVLAFGVLAIVAYRAFVGEEASWDLMALVVGAGVVGAGYRAMRGVATREWLLLLAATAGLALVVALVLAFVAP